MNVNPNKRLPIIAYSTRLDAMLIIDHKKSTDVRWYGAPISYLRYVKRRLNDYNNAEYSHRTVEIKLPEIDMTRYTSPSIMDNK